jgi:hypothetical protein
MTGKGQISPQALLELKALHKGIAIYKRPFERKDKSGETLIDDVVFKIITEDDYTFLMGLLLDEKKRGNPNPVEVMNAAIFDRCVLWPKMSIEEKHSLPIGVMPSIAKIVQEKSGFLNVDILDRILAPDRRISVIQEPAFWGDISGEELDKLKDELICKLVKVRIENAIFVIRPTFRADLAVAAQSVDDKLGLAKQLVVWPGEPDWANIPAGWVEILGEVGTSISGWDDNPIVEEI